MDSWQLNKIAGAVLGTCLVGMGIGIVAQGIYEPGAPVKPGYALPEPKETASAGGEKKPEVVPIALRMEKADPKKGEADAKVCSACHNFQEGAGAKVGPALWNVVDRPKGKAEGFDYSAGMKAKGGNWTYADLDSFITKPSAYVQGTKMGYPGQEDPEKRADIIAYLRTLSKDPKPLPKVTDADKKEMAAAGAEAKGGAGAKAGGATFVAMVAEADPKKGQSAGQVCTACHNVKKGGGTLVGPALWNVVGRKKGSVPGFDYSKGLKDKGGEWTIDDLNQWLIKPSTYIPGTKMGYPGEADEKKRAEIVAWLHSLSDNPKPLPKAAEGGQKTAAKAGESTAGGDKGGNGAGEAAGEAAILTMVGEADPKKGQSASQVCAACHNLKKGGGALIGPALWDVVNRKKGSVAGFDYSAGLKKKGGEWTIDDLNAWLTKPSAYIPGTKMGYPGEPNQKKRAEIIAYLRTLSDKPVALPGTDKGAKKAEGDHHGEAKNMPPEAKPGDQKPPAPPAPPGSPQPTPKSPEPSSAAAAPQTPDERKTGAPTPAPTHDNAAPPSQKGDASGPERKSEATPARPEQNAKAEPAAMPSSGAVTVGGSEPYRAADPQYAASAPAAQALVKADSTAPSLVTAGDKGEVDTSGPEPYSAPTPSEAK